MNCPFAQWTHANGRDTNPSAGISVKDDGTSIFNCQACHIKLPVSKMLKELSKHTGEDYGEVIGGLESEEFLGGNLKPWGVKPSDTLRKLSDPLDEAVYLDLYDPADDHWYVAHRGITPETSAALGLRVDPADSQGQERILFPVYHHKGGLYGFTGRATDPEVYPPIRDYHGLPKQFLLLGSHFIPPDAKYLILVEGLFDQAKLYQYGEPVVAYMGGFPTDDQINALLDIGLPIYFFRDNDTAGNEAQEKLKGTKLCRHLPVMKVRFPNRKVRGRDGVLKNLTDPDELTPGEVEKMRRDARLL